MSMYMGRPTGPAMGVLITGADIEKLCGEKLKGGCQEIDSRFKCVVAYQGKKYSFDKHDTIPLCNAQYDKELAKIKKKVKHVPRTPAEKGYRERLLQDGTKSFDVYLAVGGTTVWIGKKKVEVSARRLYLQAFEEEFGQIDEATKAKFLADFGEEY